MKTILAFGLPGGSEWILIVLVVLLLFGAKRLPELARGVGKSIREFKKATSEVEEDIRDAMNDEPKKSEKKAEEPKSSEKTAEKKSEEKSENK